MRSCTSARTRSTFRVLTASMSRRSSAATSPVANARTRIDETRTALITRAASDASQRAIVEPPGAVAHAIEMDPELVEQREMKIGQRRFLCVADVTPALQRC